MAVPLLELVDLAARVEGRTLFAGLSLRLSAGEQARVAGPSGSGKTVLLRVVAGLQEAAAGEVRLEGQAQEELPPPRWRRAVSLISQQPPVMPGTPTRTWSELQALGVHADRELGDPRQLARELALPEAAWETRWASLSGGERQRMHLALCLALGPELLLLDEPTSALDQEAAEAVEGLLSGRAALWVTHDAAQAARLDLAQTLELSL